MRQSNQSPGIDEAERNTATYRRFVEEVLNGGDLDAVEEFINPEFADHSLPPEVTPDLDGFRAWYREFREAIPDQRWHVDVIFARGELLGRSQTVRGTHRAELLGVGPTGREVSATEMGIVRFAEGRMVEFWGVFDEMALLRQLDAAPAGTAA